METRINQNTKRTAIKVSLVAVISLLLLIPLEMIKGVIVDRGITKNAVVEEIANSYAGQQEISAPYLVSHVYNEKNDTNKIKTGKYNIYCSSLNYKSDVKTEMLHRSVYDVIVFNSKIQIFGKFLITDKIISAGKIDFCLNISDIKGFSNSSQVSFGGQTFDFKRGPKCYVAEVKLPQDVKTGETIDFSVSFNLKGTESLSFHPSGSGTTSVVICSSYPHPSFQGTMLPDNRNIRDDGFDATWNVSDLNSSASDSIGVRFVDPANPYQQSMRSVKYGIIIIILVFVASLFVESLTRKEINPIQYSVIGLSLVLFYSLLLAFSEFIAFGIAYVIAALMTTGALVFYFRAILKNRSAYVLGGIVALVYALNYMLLQMETYALLAGSLVLFLLLCVVMYLTANINNNKAITKVEQQ